MIQNHSQVLLAVSQKYIDNYSRQREELSTVRVSEIQTENQREIRTRVLIQLMRYFKTGSKKWMLTSTIKGNHLCHMFWKWFLDMNQFLTEVYGKAKCKDGIKRQSKCSFKKSKQCKTYSYTHNFYSMQTPVIFLRIHRIILL